MRLQEIFSVGQEIRPELIKSMTTLSNQTMDNITKTEMAKLGIDVLV